jgi:hypothetical protein
MESYQLWREKNLLVRSSTICLKIMGINTDKTLVEIIHKVASATFRCNDLSPQGQIYGFRDVITLVCLFKNELTDESCCEG